MRPRIWEENAAILDFGIKMGLQFTKWNQTSIAQIPGFDPVAASEIIKSADDVYVAVAQINTTEEDNGTE